MSFLGATGAGNMGGLLNGGIIAGAGALGGFAGSQGAQSNQNQNYWVHPSVGPTQTLAQNMGANAFQNYYNLAATQAPYSQGGPAQYAQMLQQYSQNGGLPNQQQIGYANQFAQNIFAPQQAQLNNVFQQAGVNNNRQAAAMGRSINDPILAAKLAQFQGQQQGVLGGQQASLAAQFAQQLPQQQLGYAQMLSNNAFQNQQNVMGLGMNLLQNQQAWALATADRSQAANGQQGGGVGGGITGALGGMGGGMNLLNSLGRFGGIGSTNVLPGSGGGSLSSMWGEGGTFADAGGTAGAEGAAGLGDFLSTGSQAGEVLQWGEAAGSVIG